MIKTVALYIWPLVSHVTIGCLKHCHASFFNAQKADAILGKLGKLISKVESKKIKIFLLKYSPAYLIL